MVKWTRITDNELAETTWSSLDDNEIDGCAYHNGWHVYSMYAYLDETNEPYDEALDWAILFHDVVYDEKPDKELRSAELWYQWTRDVKEFEHIRDRVFDLIMATKDHLVDGSDPQVSAIVRADLHGLADRVTTFYNFEKIMRESMYLYKIDHETFAKNSHIFMSALYHRINKNRQTDIFHQDFYLKVLKGVSATMALSNIIIGA
jgi:predicted metal-dependent HD superfamily phosphohydrolase